MREFLMSTTAMVPNPVQQWQADAGATTPPAGGMQQDQTTEEEPSFEEVFQQLTAEEPKVVEVEEADAAEQQTEVEGLPDPSKVAADGATGATGSTGAERVEATPGQTGGATGPAADPRQPQNQEPPKDFFERFGQFLDARTPKEQKTTQQQPAPQGPQYTADEQAMLTAYEKEFPEVSKAEEIKRREEYKALLQYVGVQMGQVLAPLMQQSEMTTGQMHMSALQQMIPDYNQVRDPVIAWAAKQPPTYKRLYDEIVKNGSPEDIKAMVDQWRAATGAPAAQPTPAGATGAAAPSSAAGATGATGAAKPSKRVIDSLKPPGGRRTNVPQNEVAKEDYSGAFGVFADMDA